MSSFLSQTAAPTTTKTYSAGQDGGSLAEFALEIALHKRAQKARSDSIASASSNQSLLSLTSNNTSSHSLISPSTSPHIKFYSPETPVYTPQSPPPKFTHEFSGISIWLDFDEEDAKPYQALIDRTQGRCSEPSFPAHATVLYNIEPELLRNGDPTYLHKKLTETVASLPTTLIFLHPKRLVFFPYPKTADNGTGFGCLMPFWLMKLQPSLVSLFETVKTNFPPDERHGGLTAHLRRRCKSEGSVLGSLLDLEGSTMSHSKLDVRGHLAPVGKPLKKQDRSDSFHSLSGGKAYTPHVSMGYVDMARTDVVNEDECERIEKEERVGIMSKGIRAKYLSAWSTEGKVADWKLITRVPLMPQYDELQHKAEEHLGDGPEASPEVGFSLVDSMEQLAASYDGIVDFAEIEINEEF